MPVFFSYQEHFYFAFSETANRDVIEKSISPTQQVLLPFLFPRTPKPACDPPPVFSYSGASLEFISETPRHSPYHGVLFVGFVYSASFLSAAKARRPNLRVRQTPYLQ